MSRAPFRLIGWAALLSMLVSCSAEDEPLTQIVVIIDSDFSGLTRLSAKVEGFKDPTTIEADLEDEPLPRRFSLVHDGGPLGPMAVTVSAFTDGEEPILVEPRTKMFFEPGRTLLLKIDLLAACVGLCDAGEACIDPGECVSSDDAAVLIPWTGNPDDLAVGGPLDAGMDSGMTSVPDGSMEEGGVTEDTGVVDAESPPPDATDPDDAQADAADSHVDEPDADVDTGVDAFVPEPTWSYVPSNVDPGDDVVQGLERVDVVLDCDGIATIDSTDPPSTTGFCNETPELVFYDQPDDGGRVLIAVMSSLQIDSGTTLQLSGPLPIVLLVEGDATISGIIDASADGSSSGPGVDDLVCAGALGGIGSNAPTSNNGAYGASGGSGGGFGSPGSASGASGTTAAIPGGTISGDATLVPLRGGCRGGAGGLGDAVVTNAAGGGGGGAVQLSVAGNLTLTGVINAGGGGGAAGEGYQGAGGGGGSGGAVLLEALTFAIDPAAIVAVNGGAGGGGQPTSGMMTSTDGADGLASTTPSVGGFGAGTGGDGGRGASLSGAATVGGTSANSGPGCPTTLACLWGGAGGGAGGVGRIRVRGAVSCALPGIFSPAPGVACQSCGECPAQPDLSCVARELDARLYSICSSEVTATVARTLCQSAGLDLVKVDSLAENTALIAEIPADTWHWIGAADTVEDDWRWIVDNSQFWSGDEDGDPVGGAYEEWQSGEPSGSGDCARMSDDGWSDQDCMDDQAFICERP
jgi:hypothetical protein